jgi:hypothetical protein
MFKFSCIITSYDYSSHYPINSLIPLAALGDDDARDNLNLSGFILYSPKIP